MNNEYRLIYHLMGEYGWINDPNGFIHYNGMYHLFYQHNPYMPIWGDIHWGHACSDDLIKWKYLPVALAPDRSYDMGGCFSGSAVEKDGRLYALYTGNVYTGQYEKSDYVQTQCLAYSDDGILFEKHDANPVIGTGAIPAGASRKDFRDPRVFKKGDFYYAAIGSNENNGNGQVLLYKSDNLINWEYVSVMAKSDGSLGNTWECPDVFELGDKDVLIISPKLLKAKGGDFNNLHSSVYTVGSLDMNTGQMNCGDFYALDCGFDFYAPQTCIDKYGRRILIAWMDMWDTPMPTVENGHNWAGAMTLPREIFLRGDRLFFKPVEEIVNYRRNEFILNDIILNDEKSLDISGDCYELQVCFEAKEAEEFGLKLRAGKYEETTLSYNRKKSTFSFNRDKSGVCPKGERKTKISLDNGNLKLHVFVDKCSAEVFINGGEKAMSGRIYPGRDSLGIKAFSKGECRIKSLSKYDIY